MIGLGRYLHHPCVIGPADRASDDVVTHRDFDTQGATGLRTGEEVLDGFTAFSMGVKSASGGAVAICAREQQPPAADRTGRHMLVGEDA
jgi:hypothetical protein